MQRVPNRREADEALATIRQIARSVNGWQCDFLTVDMSDNPAFSFNFGNKPEFLCVNTGTRFFATNLTDLDAKMIVCVFMVKALAEEPRFEVDPLVDRDLWRSYGAVNSRLVLDWLRAEAFGR